MYILLEGMPGTGKTTFAKGLAEITGAEYVKSVISDSRFGNSIKKVRSKNINTSLELFFLSDLLFDELRVRDLLKNNNIIRDKSFIGTVAHLNTHGFVNTNKETIDSLKIGYDELKKSSIIPDLVVYLTINENRIKENFYKKKDISEIDKFLLENISLYKKQDDEIKKQLYYEYGNKVIEIECFSEVVNTICENILNEYNRRKETSINEYY